MKPTSKVSNYLKLINWKYVFTTIFLVEVFSIGFAVFTESHVFKHGLYGLCFCILFFVIVLINGYFDYVNKK